MKVKKQMCDNFGGYWHSKELKWVPIGDRENYEIIRIGHVRNDAETD